MHERVVVLACALFGVVTSCNIPPALWCSSTQIAKECQVELQCEKFVWTTESNAAPVKFTLYLESLCPDCKNFIRTQLWPTWKQLMGIMDLTLVPYGNAKEVQHGKVWKFTCQNGPEECYGNLIQTCAINIVKNVTVYFPFINCLEASKDIPRSVAPTCAKQMGIDYKSINKCVEGPLGNQLEHEMAQKTNALQPPHKYVPWVTLNGVHTEEIQQMAQSNLRKLICDTYKGPKPPACTEEHNQLRCLRE